MPKHLPTIVCLLSFISILGLGCASSRQGITISISSELREKDGSVSAAWMAYGIHKALWRTETYFKENPGDSVYVYSLAEEVDCRSSLAKIWFEMKDKKNKKDQYLDDLASVVNAGFIVEYVWHYFKQENWVAPDSLREEAYESWARENLPNHDCVTLVFVSSAEDTSKGKTQNQHQQMLNDAIGLIVKGRYDRAQSLLGRLVDSIPTRWQAYSQRGDTVFCAFWDSSEHSQCVKLNPGRVVVPEFPSYSHACYLLGFIAMQVGNREEALTRLDKSALLQPDHPVILLEKGMALAALKRPREAYECFVLAERPHYALSSIVQARVLRGQGVTLIDLGRLDEAEVCLDKSLKYDPGSKIALSEIEYIRRMRSGQAVPGAELRIKKGKGE